ncbi:MAG: coenzyme F420-0:L-glutamate ligase [Oscillospiraceae bacterium]|nr:coenzyme F420-0:L-glutamate ligase [Oscillospiraceae bacterium]
MPKIRYIARVFSGMRFKKLNSLMTVVKEKCGQSKVKTFFDLLVCFFRYGSGYYDYVMFGFYDLTAAQRDTYLTRVRNKKVCELMNDPAFGEIFDNKLLFNERFAHLLGRQVLSAETVEADKLAAFLSDNESFFAKPNRGTCGNGIEKLRTSDFADAQRVLDYVRGKNLPVLEEVIVQHEDMARLHPASVNTLRIVTDRVGSVTHIAYVVVKIGTGGGFCDNSGQGGVICRVDEKTGKICSVATDDYFHIYNKHPDTGIVFNGYALPMVQEAIALAKEASAVVPQTGHVGWDVAITPDGVVLIEGNDYPGTDLCQLAPHYPEKQGLWPYYKRILSLNRSKRKMKEEILQETPTQEESDLKPNEGKSGIIEVDGVSYQRLPIRTHLITDQDNIVYVAETYGSPVLSEAGDILFISEKCVACTQKRAIPMSEIKPRKLAVMLSKHVMKTPHGIGLGMPETMECALKECGVLRILFAAVISVIGKKIFRKKGWFYAVAGYKARSIDGPCHNTIPPYNHYVVLGPRKPDLVAKQIKERIGYDAMIVDINDLEGQILGVSSKSIDKQLYARVLKDNPLGQDDQQTPMGIIRRV